MLRTGGEGRRGGVRGRVLQMITGAVEVAGLDGGQVSLTAQQLDELDAQVDGALLRPADTGFDAAVLVWNGMVARTPALVVQPTTAHDVAAVLRFAGEHGLLLSIKGGGHHIAGTALAEGGLTLDMSRMRQITVDPGAKLAHVGPGCLLTDVDHATQEHGLATVLGFISEVGVAGLTLGGGLGYLTRRFGWTVDNLDEVEIVTADEEILQAYRQITTAAPRELAVWLILLRAPAAPFVPERWHGRRIAAMAVCYTGNLDDVDDVLAPIRALGAPVVDLLAEQPYTQVQSYLDDGEPKSAHYYWKTEYLAELSDDVLAIVRDLFANCPIPAAELGFLHLAGALNEYDRDDGAVGNRDARYVFGANGLWEPDEPDADAHRHWIRDAWTRIRPFSTGGNYINFQTADEDADRIRATYATNYRRLVSVEQQYDPDNLFRVNRNIPPADQGVAPGREGAP